MLRRNRTWNVATVQSFGRLLTADEAASTLKLIELLRELIWTANIPSGPQMPELLASLPERIELLKAIIGPFKRTDTWGQNMVLAVRLMESLKRKLELNQIVWDAERAFFDSTVQPMSLPFPNPMFPDGRLEGYFE